MLFFPFEYVLSRTFECLWNFNLIFIFIKDFFLNNYHIQESTIFFTQNGGNWRSLIENLEIVIPKTWKSSWTSKFLHEYAKMTYEMFMVSHTY